jgi:hypothetical protein
MKKILIALLMLSTPAHAAQKCWLDRVIVVIFADAGPNQFLPLNPELDDQLRTIVRRTLASSCNIGEINLHINDRGGSTITKSNDAFLRVDVTIRRGRVAMGGYNKCQGHTSDDRSIEIILPVIDEVNSPSNVVVEAVSRCMDVAQKIISALKF